MHLPMVVAQDRRQLLSCISMVYKMFCPELIPIVMIRARSTVHLSIGPFIVASVLWLVQLPSFADELPSTGSEDQAIQEQRLPSERHEAAIPFGPPSTPPAPLEPPVVEITPAPAQPVPEAVGGTGSALPSQSQALPTPPPVQPSPPVSLPTPLEVVAQSRKGLQLEPDALEPRLKLGNALFQLGDTDGAIDEYRTALRFHPTTAQGHLDLGTALMAKQDWRGAATELQEAIRLDPSLTAAHYTLGAVQYTRGNVQSAIQAYQEALRQKPDFSEAHYRLGLVLKLAGREKEAAQELEAAALAGLAKAQYFLGNAYRSGHGVDKNQVMAITWWSRAFEQGLPEAAQALTQLRRLAAVRGPLQTKQSKAASEAFRDYCEQLWLDFPDVERDQPGETLGTTLLKLGRTADALPVLLRESYALNDIAHAALVDVYEKGLDGQLPPHGQWILTFLETTAGDGVLASKVALARVYGKGEGVQADLAKAKAYLKGVPKDEAKRLLEEVSSDGTKQ
jgi:tetratricopeptide (TPR) repeat protein